MFSECLSCPKLGVSCAGPNFFAMSSHDLLEWCKERKARLGLSNAKLSEISGTPKGTIDRLFSKEYSDYKYDTIRPMIKSLVGGDCDNMNCPLKTEPDDEGTRRKVDFLKEQLKISQEISRGRKMAIILLSVTLFITLLLIISALVIDKMNPDIGFFWREISWFSSENDDLAYQILKWRL